MRVSHYTFSPEGFQSRAKRSKPRDIEGPIHTAILDYLRLVLPAGSVVFHVPNENRREGEEGKIDRAMQKRKGVLPGVSDLICLLDGGVTLFFEVKAPKGSVSDAQRDFLGRLHALGFRHAVVRSVDDARDALAAWKVQTREVLG